MWSSANNRLTREFHFPDFRAAWAFMQAVALEAERRDHHPGWWNEYGYVRIELCSHDAGHTITDRDHRLAAAIAGQGSDVEVISAAALWPEIREYERCLVAVMGAHIHGTVKRYLENLQRRLADLAVTAPLFISASNGGSLSVESAIARPLDTILSGPASGVTAARMHYPGQNLVTFDMGGISSDISIIV